MKNAISAATLGLASCKTGELSLANSLYEKNLAQAIRNERAVEAQQLTDTVANADESTGRPIKNGGCIKFGGDMHIWDLKLLESNAASESEQPGFEISGKKNADDKTFSPQSPDFNGRFMYKICQSEWDYPHDDFDAPKNDEPAEDHPNFLLAAGQKDKSIAYWGMRDDNEEVQLQKTFERPTWNATLVSETENYTGPDDWKYSGLWINFKAENITENPEDCELQGPNTVQLQVTCDVDGEHGAEVQWKGPGEDLCNPVFTADHRGGCSWNSQKSFSAVSKFTGAILIAIGATMTIIGARFIMWVLGFLIFAAIQGIFFTVSYSAGFIDPISIYESQV